MRSKSAVSAFAAIAVIFSLAWSICIPKSFSYIRYIAPFFSIIFSGVRPRKDAAGTLMKSKIRGFWLNVKTRLIETMVVALLIPRSLAKLLFAFSFSNVNNLLSNFSFLFSLEVRRRNLNWLFSSLWLATKVPFPCRRINIFSITSSSTDFLTVP